MSTVELRRRPGRRGGCSRCGRAARRASPTRTARSCWQAAPLHAAPTSSRLPRTPTGEASRSGSATTAASPPTIPARISCSFARRCSSGSSVPPTRASDRDRPSRSPRRPRPTTPPSRASRSTSSCSGSAPDGHTASLFPGAPALDERDRLAVAAEPGLEPFVERVTLTIPALESGSHVVFLAVGEEKAVAARRAFAEEPSKATPASLVRSRSGTDDGDSRRRRGVAARPDPGAAAGRLASRGRPAAVPAAEPLARRRARAVRAPAATRRHDREVDVAIVGAGFTGLWTAYALTLRDPGLRIAIVEAETVGYGASGRNGGFVSAGIAGEARVYSRRGGRGRRSPAQSAR